MGGGVGGGGGGGEELFGTLVLFLSLYFLNAKGWHSRRRLSEQGIKKKKEKKNVTEEYSHAS